MATQSTIECTNCEQEVKRSTSLFGQGKEFPKLVEDGKAEADDDVSLCYDCYTELK